MMRPPIQDLIQTQAIEVLSALLLHCERKQCHMNQSLQFALQNCLNSHEEGQTATKDTASTGLFALPEFQEETAAVSEPASLEDVEQGVENDDDVEDVEENDMDEEMEDAEEDDEEEEEEDEDDELGYTLDSEKDAEATINTLFKIIVEQFGEETARDMIIKCSSAAQIGLFKTKTRDGGILLPTLKVEVVRAKIQQFQNATLDTNVTMKTMDSIANIVDNCVVVNQQLVNTEAAKDISQVRSFAYLYHLNSNIQAAKNSRNVDFKTFLKTLKEKLKPKSASQVSKLQRKAKRVAELVETIGNRPGAYILGMYITVHTLENEKDSNWNRILDDLLENREYLAFSMTLTLGADSVTPLLV
ncbi:hypothetical protein MBANPS3_012159 [Mucor bainieri]